MTQCKACDTSMGSSSSEVAVELCTGCVVKQLACRVCGKEFAYQDILDDLPVVQCPSCEGRAIEVLE